MSGALLTKVEVRAICGRVRALPDRRRPTWNCVVDAAKAVVGRSFSRQALSDHKSIKKAYDERVCAYQTAARSGRNEDPDAVEDPAVRRYRLLQEENERLKLSIVEYDRRWQILLEQAQLRGMDVRALAGTLTQLHREGRTAPMTQKAGRVG